MAETYGQQMLRGAMATVAGLAMLVACAPSATTSASISPRATGPLAPAPLGAAGCQPASPSGAFAAEVYGTASGGTVWAWFMQAYPPRAGIEDKTVWRLDGAQAFGSPAFTLTGPEGQSGRLDWGPEEHGGSSWNRPGHEFGTGLLFPTAGCWKVHVTLDQLTGDLYVVVAS